MINVDFFCEHDGELVGFEIRGHANNNVNGKDIICAAVSSAAYMTANTITDVINISADAEVYGSGNMYLRMKKNDAISCRDIMLGFKLHMISLEEQYPKNIVVNYLEV